MSTSARCSAVRADIVREMIDGATGLLKDSNNLPANDPAWWHDYHDQVQQAARTAAVT